MIRAGTGRVLLWCAAAAGGLWWAGRIWPVLWPLVWPFAAGALMALGMEPAVAWLEARGFGRRLAAGLCLGAGLVVGSLGAAWVALITWRELWRLKDRLPEAAAAAAAMVGDLGRRAGSASAGLPPGLRVWLAAEVRRAYDAGEPLLQRLAGGIEHTAAGIPDVLFAYVIAFAAAYFAAADRPALSLWVRARLPAGRVAALVAVAETVRAAVGGLLRAQLLLGAATFTVSLLGLWIIGAPYVMLAALAAAVFDLLPVVGPAALYVPWIVGCALSGLGGAAVALLCVMTAVAAVRWALTPLLLGRQVGLHPFIALGAMYVGSRLGGVGGLLLGPLAAAAVAAVLDPPAPPSGRADGAASAAPPWRGVSVRVKRPW